MGFESRGIYQMQWEFAQFRNFHEFFSAFVAFDGAAERSKWNEQHLMNSVSVQASASVCTLDFSFLMSESLAHVGSSSYQLFDCSEIPLKSSLCIQQTLTFRRLFQNPPNRITIDQTWTSNFNRSNSNRVSFERKEMPFEAKFPTKTID